MVCTRCGTYIEDGETVCYKCGFIFEENVQPDFNQQPIFNQQPAYNQGNFNQPQGGFNQQPDPYASAQGGYNDPYAQGYGGYGQNDKNLLYEFVKEAKSLQTTGIVGAIFLLGFIGLGCSIAIWVKRSKVKIPQLMLSDPMEIAMFEKAKKQYNTAFILSFIPIVGFIVSFIIGFVSAL